MFCFSSPSDPVPGAAPASEPPAGAPPAAPTAAPGESPPPAAEAPAGEAPGAAAPGCGPGAVAPCPCASATVTSEMVMPEPPDRARTRMGVGERVRVTYSLGSAEWSLAGEGQLSATEGTTVTFTAPSTAGSVTLTATATGSGCSASITFTVVAPTAVRMIKKFTSAARVEHTQTFPDVGMFTNIFLAPDDVNFHRVQFLELEIGCTATGVYACLNGSGHGPNPNGLGATTHVQHGMGTFMDAQDHCYSGHCGIAHAAPATGTEHFAIPWRWRVGGAGAFHALTTVNQRVNCDAAGLCTLTKAGARVSVQAAAATSTP